MAKKNVPPLTEGTYSENDQRRVFVEGAMWWEFNKTGATMWPSDRDLAEQEAEKRFNEIPEIEALKDAINEIVFQAQSSKQNPFNIMTTRLSDAIEIARRLTHYELDNGELRTVELIYKQEVKHAK